MTFLKEKQQLKAPIPRWVMVLGMRNSLRPRHSSKTKSPMNLRFLPKLRFFRLMQLQKAWDSRILVWSENLTFSRSRQLRNAYSSMRSKDVAEKSSDVRFSQCAKASLPM